MVVHLITGGGGYLGSYLAHSLLELDHQVRVYDLKKARPLPSGVEFIKGNILDRDQLVESLQGVDVVHHLAFVQSMSRLPEKDQRQVAIEGTRNVLEVAAQAGVKRVVFTSTIEIYGTCPPFPCPEDAPKKPVGLYGRLKWEAEELAFSLGRELDLEVTALRMPTICGSGFFNHRPMLNLLERIREGKAVAMIGSGKTKGDYVHIHDVVQSYILAAERKEAVGEAFNISCRAPSTHLNILQAKIAGLHSSSSIYSLPRILARLALPLGRLFQITELPADQDGYLFYDNSYSVEKARKLLGYDPRYSASEAAGALAKGYVNERNQVRERSENY